MPPISADEAFKHTANDPQSYNLPADASEEQLNAKRQEAAQQLMAGIAANDAYWNSRGELEQVIARAQGHGVVQRAEEPSSDASGIPIGADVESTAVEEPVTGPAPALSGTGVAPVGSVGETSGESHLAPSPDNPNETIARLRQQLRDAGQNPEA